ncbi:hypothetical protein CKA32_002501 [Geitlerinema sp. FC II]|nr:hypothetical protein CKA32_002501 [Geitlerinema sp. FC II]
MFSIITSNSEDPDFAKIMYIILFMYIFVKYRFASRSILIRLKTSSSLVFKES